VKGELLRTHSSVIAAIVMTIERSMFVAARATGSAQPSE